jgi:hypothetical protein
MRKVCVVRSRKQTDRGKPPDLLRPTQVTLTGKEGCSPCSRLLCPHNDHSRILYQDHTHSLWRMWCNFHKHLHRTSHLRRKRWLGIVGSNRPPLLCKHNPQGKSGNSHLWRHHMFHLHSGQPLLLDKRQQNLREYRRFVQQSIGFCPGIHTPWCCR